MTAPATVEEWHGFLRAHSAAHLASRMLRELVADGRIAVSEQQRRTGWLGREPATEDAVQAAEERLGCALPPSFRNFLLVSDGWSESGDELHGLFRLDGVGRFEDLRAELMDAWADLDFFADELAVLRRSLLIADHEDGVYWVLSPDSGDADGGWTACVWDTADGAPAKYRTFGDLVADALA
ncbi:SMI1/KNR4 family protein [Saccharopolyspora sp. NPDC047091]|uniref:SMI1/KNR4 family protein n=1 Tax=Saccharopolyspora sp. NPDC047091 TaxID=3155924 RepID=UPI0033D3C472